MSDAEDDRKAIEAYEQCVTPHLRDILRREHDEWLKGKPHNIALEIWGPSIEHEILLDLRRGADHVSQTRRTSAEVLELPGSKAREDKP